MIVEAAGGQPTLLAFAGELTDSSGLIYLRSRWYDPSVGRLLSRDSFAGVLTVPSSLNSYGYVGGNPVNRTDPSGECAPPLIVVCAMAARAAIGAAVGAGTYTASIVVTNLVRRYAFGDANRNPFDGFEPNDAIISAAVGAFGGAISVPRFGLNSVDQFYLNTLAGYTGALASVTLGDRSDFDRDWIKVVMGTAFSGYGFLNSPPGFAGVGFGVGLGVLQSVYEAFLNRTNSGASPIGAGPQDGRSSK